jgi:dihydrofolate reductase
MTQPIKLILAVDVNGVIGYQGINQLPWYFPEDLKRFKKLTYGQSLIMGLNTYSSLPKLLPGRTHFVISRNRFDDLGQESDVFQPCRRFEEAVKKAQILDKEIFVIGGAEVYNYCFERRMVDEVYLTRVYLELFGDNLATVDLSRLKTEFTIHRTESSGNGGCSFLHYVRVR